MRVRRRLLAAITGGVVFAAAAPVLAMHQETTDTGQALADATDLQAGVDAKLGHLAAGEVLPVFVHGTTIDDAIAAVDNAGLRLVESYDLVGIAVAVGTADQLAVAAGQPGVTHLEDASTPIDFFLDSSHEATRGKELIEGVDLGIPAGSETEGETPDAEGGDTGKGKANGKDKNADKGKGKAKGKNKGDDPSDGPTTQRVQATGAGISIAIIDSGVDAEHPFFQVDGESKVKRNLEFVCSDVVTLINPDDPLSLSNDAAGQPCLIDAPAPQSDTTSAGGHGTHVAGIAAGVPVETEAGPLMGAAPGAELISISAGVGLNITGGTSGMYWVLENHADPCGDGSCSPIKVVNNSWGSDGGDHNPNAASAKIGTALVDEGVVVVWAAGNDGGDGSRNDVNPQAQNPTPGILSVANYDDGGTGNRDNALDSSSSRGEEGRPATYPDVMAPGADITSSCRVYLPVCSTGLDFVEDGDYNTISGTSMAAPHVAGIVAQLFELNPELTPAAIEDILEDTAHKPAFGGAYEADPVNPDDQTSFDKGHGLVDVVAAAAAALGLEAPSAAAVCTAEGDLATDAVGDDAENGVLSGTGSLDIVRGRADWDAATETLTATIEVADLSVDATVPIAHRATFVHGGQSLFVLSEYDQALDTVEFQYGYVGTISRTVGTTTGTLDVASNTITLDFTNALVESVNAEIAENGDGTVIQPLADGDVLGGWNFAANRRYSAVVVSYNPPADQAGATCPYTIGLGAVAPVVEEPEPGDGGGEPVELGEADYDLDPTNTTFTREAEPRTAVNEFGIGVGITGPASDEFTFNVRPGALTTVDIVAEATNGAEVQDIDFDIFDANGTKVASSGNPGGREDASFTVSGDGQYTVEVRFYSTVEAGYILTATLG